MTKRINGVYCNTDTAKLLFSAGNNLHYDDLNCWEENLYRTKTGFYFLNKYQGWNKSEEIILITEEEAKKWGEKKLTAEQYNIAFDTNNEKTKILVSLSPSAIEELNKIKKEKNLNQSEAVELSIRYYYYKNMEEQKNE